MLEIQNENIKIGDVYRGKINNAIITIKQIDEENGIVIYEVNNRIFYYGLDMFKKCFLEKLL